MKIKPVVNDKKTHDVVETPISTKPVKKKDRRNLSSPVTNRIS